MTTKKGFAGKQKNMGKVQKPTYNSSASAKAKIKIWQAEQAKKLQKQAKQVLLKQIKQVIEKRKGGQKKQKITDKTDTINALKKRKVKKQVKEPRAKWLKKNQKKAELIVRTKKKPRLKAELIQAKKPEILIAQKPNEDEFSALDTYADLSAKETLPSLKKTKLTQADMRSAAQQSKPLLVPKKDNVLDSYNLEVDGVTASVSITAQKG